MPTKAAKRPKSKVRKSGAAVAKKRSISTELVRFVAPVDAARYAGVSLPTIRRMLADGRLTPYRPSPRRVVVDLQQIDAFILSTGTRLTPNV